MVIVQPNSAWLLRTGHITSLRRLFAFLRDNE